MADATFVRETYDLRKTAAAAIASGEIHQLANGRAGYYTGLNAAASGDRTNWRDEGQVVVTKTSSQVWIDGQPIYWDHSANSATCLTPTSDRDFFIGVAVGDAASSDTTGTVDLNKEPKYICGWGPGTGEVGENNSFTTNATNGLGTTLLVGGGLQMAFDAVAEAAMAANISDRTFTLASNWIVEGRINIVDGGDNAALDIDVGIANGTHATDFESITEFVAFHFDGNSTNIALHSDDGTTDVTPTDTTTDYTLSTAFDFVIDGRDPSDIQCYVNGVLMLTATTFTLAAATGPFKLIAHMEKTSDDTTADVRIPFLRVRTAEQ